MKPRITGNWRTCYSDGGSPYVIWRCSAPGSEPKPTGVGLTPRAAYQRWWDRFFSGVTFAALGVGHEGHLRMPSDG